VLDGALGEWDTGGLDNGPHTLRLVVRDTFGSEYEARVRVFVEQPTPTPEPTATWTPLPPTPTWTPEPPTPTWTPEPQPTEIPADTQVPDIPPAEAAPTEVVGASGSGTEAPVGDVDGAIPAPGEMPASP
jgi:hypothetical protein